MFHLQALAPLHLQMFHLHLQMFHLMWSKLLPVLWSTSCRSSLQPLNLQPTLNQNQKLLPLMCPTS